MEIIPTAMEKQSIKYKTAMTGQWWHKTSITALRRQRQADLSDCEASLVYGVSSRTARATQRNPARKIDIDRQTD